MDEQGIQRTLMFPALASLLEERVWDDPELTRGDPRLKQRMDEVWSFDHRDGIFSTRGIGKSDSSPAFGGGGIGPLRSRTRIGNPPPRRISETPSAVCELGVTVCDAWPLETKLVGPCWSSGSSTGARPRVQIDPASTSQRCPACGTRDREARESQACFTVLVLQLRRQHRRCERGAHYRTRAGLVCTAAGPAVAARGRSGLPGRMNREPQPEVPLLRARVGIPLVYEGEEVNEDDMAALADLLGIDRVLFGSDYPHPEGKADPITFVDDLASFTEEAKAKIMGGNLSRLIPV
nr:hypothetical protein GCM10010200_079640 [Actinomadura rugatobispora]